MLFICGNHMMIPLLGGVVYTTPLKNPLNLNLKKREFVKTMTPWAYTYYSLSRSVSLESNVAD